MSNGFSMQFPPDPNAYAAQYAKENNITLDEAKNQLRAKYGDPTPPQNFMQEGFKTYYQPQPMPPAPAPAPGTVPPAPAPAPAPVPGPAPAPVPAAVPSPAAAQERAAADTVQSDKATVGMKMSRKEKKEWIKNYMQEHNCSKKEAKKAFKDAFYVDKMSSKEAKEWVKNYQETHKCSKKEAKQAFEQTFGYHVPSTKTQRFFKGALLMLMSPVAFPLGLIDEISGGKLEFNKSVSEFMA